ncbi:UV excision repair protein rad23 [Malassezia sp. CBS 17886]|nr:UV excision repair protein rad23 [Malassezia sp. CBS 17886]
MKLLVKSLAGGNFHVDVDPSDTIESVKKHIETAQGHAVENQKLIFAGKILTNDKTVAACDIKEKDFLVVMVSKPKMQKPAPQPAKEVAAEGGPTKDAAKEAPAQEVPATEAPVKEAPADAPTSSAPSAPAAQPASGAAAADTGFRTHSFLSGSELEAAVNGMVEMGFSREDAQRAMRMSFNNPDRAVEHLMNVRRGRVCAHRQGLPEEPAPAAPAAAGDAPAAAGDAPAAAGDAPAAGASPADPAPAATPAAVPASGNLFEQAAALAASGGGGAQTPAGADALPGEDDGHGRQVIDLGNPQILAQLRTLVEQNPSALQPLIQALVQSNPQLAEALSADPEGVLRLLAGSEGMEGIDGEESFEVPTLQQLSEEDRTHVEQIIAMGIPESKAIESYFMCGKNLEMAVQYYFENPGDFED